MSIDKQNYHKYQKQNYQYYICLSTNFIIIKHILFFDRESMNNRNQFTISMKAKMNQTMMSYPPKNDRVVDESNDDRWKASFDFKKNINKMYYANLNDRYELKYLLDNGYKQIGKIVEQGYHNYHNRNMVEKKILDKSNQKKTSPRILSLMKKYQKLLTHKYFKKEVQQQKINQNLLYLQFSQAKKQILKKYSELNNHQLTKHFQDLITNHDLFSYKKGQGQEVVFEEIVKKISPRMNYNVYLPTMVKVILANVNWIDRENDTASLALKIEVKVNVPGISQYPYFYQKVFKEKMKISLKTQNRSNIYNQKIKFNGGKNETQTLEIKNDKIIKNNTKSKYYSDCGQFFQTVYKWLNYEKPTYIYHKRVQDFEGFIVEATVSDIRVLVSNENEMSPFEMIDLYGIVQLESIVTEMKDWISILYDQEQEKKKKEKKKKEKENQKDDSENLKKFLIEASPKVTIKFNLISLYQNKQDVQNNEKISLNHIRSFDAVECNGYKLAQNLMFLQTSNQRESRYQLFKFSKCRASYKWQLRKEIYQYIKNKIPELSSSEQKLEQENYYQQNDQGKLSQYLKISNFKSSPEKKRLFLINKRFQTKFKQIRLKIMTENQQEFLEYQQKMNDCDQAYYPENLTYDKTQKYLDILKSMYKANLDNQIQINKQFGSKHHQKFEIIAQHIYKFSQLKYKFQNYYRRILEILISQFHAQKWQEFETQYQQKKKKNLQNLKEMLREAIYNHQHSENQEKNLANVKTDQDYHYSKAIYHFPFYKDPTPTLVLLFSSPFVLCVINLFVFFQELVLSDRLATVTALMICFIGMVAIMQKQMHSSTISSFEFLLYAMMLTPLLCLAFSLDCYLNQVQPTIDKVLSSPLFWISIIISVLGIFLPGIFLLFYKCHEQYIYQKDQNAQKQMQPLFLLFPGSPQVDEILKQNQDSDIEEVDDNWSNQTKDGSRKPLHRVVTNLMFKHLNNLYQLRKSKDMTSKETKLKSDLHKQIKLQMKFIENTFETPKKQQNTKKKETLQGSTQTIDSPLKQGKTKLILQQLLSKVLELSQSLKS